MTVSTRIFAIAGTAATAVALGLGSAATASADPDTADFGTPQELDDGVMATSYTVSVPEPSSEQLDVPVTGELYSADVTVESVRGTVTPAIPMFNARSEDGTNYRVLYPAVTPESVTATPLPEGAAATGKIYFDVSGSAPTSVVYRDAVADRLVWTEDAET